MQVQRRNNIEENIRKTERLLYSYRDMVYVVSHAPSQHLTETKEIIEVIEACFECLKNEPYADILKYKYIEQLSDEKISELKYCDPSTITRHIKKLIKRVSNMLFPSQLF